MHLFLLDSLFDTSFLPRRSRQVSLAAAAAASATTTAWQMTLSPAIHAQASTYLLVYFHTLPVCGSRKIFPGFTGFASAAAAAKDH